MAATADMQIDSASAPSALLASFKASGLVVLGEGLYDDLNDVAKAFKEFAKGAQQEDIDAGLQELKAGLKRSYEPWPIDQGTPIPGKWVQGLQLKNTNDSAPLQLKALDVLYKHFERAPRKSINKTTFKDAFAAQYPGSIGDWDDRLVAKALETTYARLDKNTVYGVQVPRK